MKRLFVLLIVFLAIGCADTYRVSNTEYGRRQQHWQHVHPHGGKLHKTILY